MSKLSGTAFQLKVWNYLKKIPKGKVKTYLDVAKGIGKPRAFRAVANAVGKNPYPPKIPCHRVIRSDLMELSVDIQEKVESNKKDDY